MAIKRNAKGHGLLRERKEVRVVSKSLEQNVRSRNKLLEWRVQMKVCEHEIKGCPYCLNNAEGHLDEQHPPLIPGTHTIVCSACGNEFYVPCED